MSIIKAVDLFCGCGGFSEGLSHAGLDVVGGFDNNESLRFAYEQAHAGSKFNCADLYSLPSDDVARCYGDSKLRLLAASPPCQGFSSANPYISLGDPRRGLIGEVLRLVQDIRPEFIAIENVPSFANSQELLSFMDAILRLGYQVSTKIVSCDELGLPQKRRRFILLASLLGQPYLLDLCAGRKSVRDAIGHLPVISAGETCKSDRYHRAAGVSDINLNRLKATPEGGGYECWPADLRLDVQNTVSYSYKDAYSRGRYDEASSTVTSKFAQVGSGRSYHPEQPRAFSLREIALLQGFGAAREFVEPSRDIVMSEISLMIGNAVPPVLGEYIGECLLNMIKPNKAKA